MFEAFRKFCERLLRIPPEPESPPGDEGSTKVFRASPNYLRYLILRWAVTAVMAIGLLLLFEVVPLIAETATANKEIRKFGPVLIFILTGILLLVVAGQLVRLAVLRLDYEKRWYVVTDRSLRIREGVVNVREMTVTFANIQNISVSQGPLQRLFKIADLRVDTAGGGGAEAAKHPGLNLHTAWFRGIENGEEVKALIQARLRGLKDSGLGDHEERRAVAPPTSEWHVAGALREVLAEARALRAAASRG
jgi:membrane protein YdbS with pleckstrin-like domain